MNHKQLIVVPFNEIKDSDLNMSITWREGEEK